MFNNFLFIKMLTIKYLYMPERQSMMRKLYINPLVMNEVSHPYYLDESTLILGGIRKYFSLLFHFSMKSQ